jgi:hypothetical protein
VSWDDGGPERKLRTLLQNNTSSFPSHAPRFFLSALFFCFFTAAFFCLPGTTALWGQEIGYRIEEDGRFVQILNWDAQEYVLYYGVEIEKQTGEAWEEALAGKSEDIFLEISLEPGLYRYRVRAYDFLERPGLASGWIQFEILPARQPELFRFSPDRFYLDEDAAWVITLSGRNLSEGIEIFLEGFQGNRIKPETVTVGQSLNEARLTFGYDQLDMGTYVIHVTNPGGLTAEIATFRVAFRKPVDINIVAGYRPLISLYGHINELVETIFFPAGAYSRLSIIPIKQLWGYIGVEIEPSWNYILAVKDRYDVQAQMPGAAVYVMYRRWFANRAVTLDFRIGGGLYSFLDYHLTFDRGATDSIIVLTPALVAGLSFQWNITKSLFMDAGLDFSQLLTVDNPPPGYLWPFAGLGWRF